MSVRFPFIVPLLAAMLGLFPATAIRAETVTFVVTDAKGDPVEGAVVAVADDGGTDKNATPSPVRVDQIDKEFVNRVTVVRAHTPVMFPNKDQIRHHVYSFSPAKRFELPLYMGTPAEPVVFDKPGPVALGCNIHDWMSGFIYVVDTPYYAVTDASGVTRIDLPKGERTATVWRQDLKGPVRLTATTFTVDADQTVPLSITLRELLTPRRGPSRAGASGGGY